MGQDRLFEEQTHDRKALSCTHLDDFTCIQCMP